MTIVTEDILSKLLGEDIFLDDTKDGTCHPSNQTDDYFLKSISTALDTIMAKNCRPVSG